VRRLVDTLDVMARSSVSVWIARPPAEVWVELERLEDHAEWMADAVGIEFLTERRRGIGTRMKVDTRVGPLRTSDVLEFTEWDPPHVMGVAHRGLITGEGRFRLIPDGSGTQVDWSERIRLPWFFAGPIGAAVAAPILHRIWRANLRRLKERVEG
jgi:carbon monoxide dehydrogenase subunit G